VQRAFDRLGRCTVTVCEGQLDERGEPFGADLRLSSRGPLATNLAHRLALLITRHLGLKARGEKPGLVGRVSRELRSDVDWREATLCGEAAVRAAMAGQGGVMVTLEREPGPVFPADWIEASGHDVRPQFRAWASPLVGSIAGDEALDP
jgi:6-phosphofructokinase 1